MSVQVTVEHLGDVQFEVNARGHKVICDQPENAGGWDEGITPPELLLASLGTCAGYYAAEYARRNRLPEGVRVQVTAEKVSNPARLDKFRITLQYAGAVEPKHRQGLLKSVEKCLIKNTLAFPPSMRVDLEAPGGAVETFAA